LINGKTILQWAELFPQIHDITRLNELFWTNPIYQTARGQSLLSFSDLKDAEERLARFAPYIAKVFPETERDNGMIESPLVPISNMQNRLQEISQLDFPGRLLLKCDNDLPISGSIKARGGIYEVLQF